MQLMKKSRKKRLILLAICGLVVTNFIGCSSENKKNVEMNKDSKVEKNSVENPGKGPEVEIDNTVHIDKNKMYHLGDVVPSLNPLEGNPDNIGVEYVINSATIFENIEKAQLKEDEMTQVYTEEGGVQKIDENSILVCEMDIKNVSESYLNITDISLVHVISESEEVKFVSDPVYFSKKKSDKEKDYYNYTLLKGQSMKAKVAWLVDLTKIDKENMYLCVKYLGDDPLYIDLGL